MQSIIKFEFKEHLKTSQATFESIGHSVEVAAKLCIDCLKNGNKILLFGNGGSAADAQHMPQNWSADTKPNAKVWQRLP